MSAFNTGLLNLDEDSPVGQRILGLTQGQPQQQARVPSAEAMLRPLYEQRATKSVPTDPTGDDYRMGIGGRILGTLANFLSGVNGGGATVYTGPGATNNRYAQAERRRVGELTGLNDQIADTEKLSDARRNDYVLATQQEDRAQKQKMVDPDSVYYDEQNGKWKGRPTEDRSRRLRRRTGISR
ncbi:MAG: hypothetical protein DMG65_13680 [Candidatus Angelobacter sp. Gp1-AA117]|nr:MAG: hypothetical protein DMG65_13680 [Candidatus Angelobacter sp. Gp1-AA117]